MAVTSGFFNSLNGDRKYNAEQFSALFDNLITDGVFANVGTAFEVKATPENTITIGIGRAWFNSIWLYNDALYPMVPQEPEVLLNRIDAIVIEINHNEAVRSGQIRWVYGTPSSEPVRPTLTNTDEVHQYPLAYVYRHAGVSDVIQADITNMIGTSACPYVTGILSTQSIDKVVAQWESQFNVWFDGLQTELDGDVAANLANQVLDLQSRFHDLAKDRAVYEVLQDSTGATIKDSNGGDILARTVLGGEDVIINYPTGGAGADEVDGFEVGDILTTVRTDLDDKWLLCNGANLDRDAYPELNSARPKTPLGNWYENNTEHGSRTDTYIGKVAFGNGWYVHAIRQTQSGTNYLTVYYTKDPNGSWTEKIIDSNGKNREITICGLAYGNGYFVLYGFRHNQSQNVYEHVIYYTTDPSSTWTSVVKHSAAIGRTTASVSSLAFLNGQFVMTYEENFNQPYQSPITSTIRVAYSDNPASWTTTSNIISFGNMGDHGSITCAGYFNGYYILAARYVVYNGSNVTGYLYTSQLDSAWTFVNMFSQYSFTANSPILGMIYVNGQYVFCLYANIPSLGSPGRYLYAVDDITNFSFSASNFIEVPDAAYNYGNYAYGIFHVNSYVCLMGGDSIYAIPDTAPLNSEWVGKPIFADTGVFSSRPTGINACGADENFILAITTDMIGDDKRYTRRAYIDMRKISIPSISYDGVAYSYIKVRSEATNGN